MSTIGRNVLAAFCTVIMSAACVLAAVTPAQPGPARAAIAAAIQPAA